MRNVISPLAEEETGEVKDRSFVTSLSRGLAVLEAVANNETDISLGDLAKRVKLTKSNTWRLVHTLIQLGYLRQDSETRCFSLSSRVLALGYAYFDRLSIKQLASPYMATLSARVNEMVNLAILDTDELVFVERIKTSQMVSINVHVGSRFPLYSTAIGRVLISEMSPAWLRQYLAWLSGDPKARLYTQDGGKKLFQMLADIRERRYELSDNERVEGFLAVACPIRDQNAVISGAINIVIPSVRATVAEMHGKFAPQLLETASQISAALGFRRPRPAGTAER